VDGRGRDLDPLGVVKARVDRILATQHDRFAAAYSRSGLPHVPPERLPKGLQLKALNSLPSERPYVEQIDTDLLFRWFLNMDPGEPVFHVTARVSTATV